MQDKLSQPRHGSVRLRGLIGTRVDACRANRIATHDEAYLLWPFEETIPIVPRDSSAERYYEEVAPLREPLGEHSWLHPRGMAPRPQITVSDWHPEMLGTWLATASVMAYDADDLTLRDKIDRVLSRWLTSQRPDGYLGAYVEGDRWKSWDLWAEGHSMTGLLVHHELSNEPRALDAARRIADRILMDFGPAKASLVAMGPHGGLASSSVLEPITLLYRYTQDERYLAFARWLVDEDWETEHGPRTVSALTTGAGVRAVGNAKAVEMLLTLIGLIELFRETDKHLYFSAAEAAWNDIVEGQLYVTGSASVGEYFGNASLPNDGSLAIGETCVTMAWIIFCLSLHRLTGHPKYFEQAERAIYNHLLAAQSEDGRGWAYYVGLRDYKRHREHTDPDCCPSRGSKAMSVLPGAALATADNTIFVNLYESLSATLTLDNVGPVQFEVNTDYPFEGQVRIQLRLKAPAAFSLCLRRPGWCQRWGVVVNGAQHATEVDTLDYLRVNREWASGDEVVLSLEMLPRIIADAQGNAGHVAFARGPLVFAADVALLPKGRLLEDVVVQVSSNEDSARYVPAHGAQTNTLEVHTARLALNGESAFGDGGRYHCINGVVTEDHGAIALVPFYQAGNSDPDSYRDGVWNNREVYRRATYQVWLPVLPERR